MPTATAAANFRLKNTRNCNSGFSDISSQYTKATPAMIPAEI